MLLPDGLLEEHLKFTCRYFIRLGMSGKLVRSFCIKGVQIRNFSALKSR